MKTLRSLPAALLLLAASLAPMSAQNFTMPRFAIGGGGGVSADAVFRVAGAIGQPVSGELSDGRFTLWSGFLAPFDSPPGPYPGLGIRLGMPMAGTNTVVLRWLNPSTGYVLQQTANMNGPGGGWTDVPQQPVIVGQFKEVTLPATGQSCLFRLRRP